MEKIRKYFTEKLAFELDLTVHKETEMGKKGHSG